MTVGELLNRADSRELSEWMAYFIIEKKRADRAAMEQKAEAGLSNAKRLLKNR